MSIEKVKVKEVGTRPRAAPRYTVVELKEAVMGAIFRLYAEDHSLIRRGVNEMALTFRLAFYLQERFPDYDVDCEYNRNIEDPKITPYHSNSHGARPDILVHRREVNAPTNLILLEAKRVIKGVQEYLSPADLQKVHYFVNGEGRSDPYQYHLGVVLLLGNRTFDIEFIERRPPPSLSVARISGRQITKKSTL